MSPTTLATNGGGIVSSNGAISTGLFFMLSFCAVVAVAGAALVEVAGAASVEAVYGGIAVIPVSTVLLGGAD